MIIIFIFILLLILLILVSFNISILSSFNGNFAKMRRGGQIIGVNNSVGIVSSQTYMEDPYNFDTLTGVLTIHPDISSISGAFSNNKNIKSINIIDRPIGNTLEIHSNVFCNCDISGALLIPSCVTRIGNNAFSNNINITHIYMIDSNSQMDLGYTPFNNIPPLKLVILPIKYYDIYIQQTSDSGRPNITIATCPELIRLGIKVIDDDPRKIIKYGSPECEEILNRTLPDRIAANRKEMLAFIKAAQSRPTTEPLQPVSEMSNKIRLFSKVLQAQTPKGDNLRSYLASFSG